ncbi:MAG: hypothetical protein K6T86_06430 [Pirellulales bacterium]|nr:hypothetical protein [Pirellulales bacterium]
MNTLPSPQQINEADTFLDSEAQHQAAVRLGDKLYEHFAQDRGGRVSTQIRNLEQIVVSATRLCDIEDFVRNQMGREGETADQWRKVGDEILEQLKTLRSKAEKLSKVEEERLLLRLHLARGWIRAVVGGYLYKKATSQLETSRGRR